MKIQSRLWLYVLDVCTVYFVELYYICPTDAQYININFFLIL
jgi:hypothetical protein